MSKRVITGPEWRKAGFSKAMHKAEEAAAERLRTDPQVQKIVEWLREKEVSTDKVNTSLAQLPRIIGDCERLKSKTLNKITQNSVRLAKKIREVLKEMDIYRDGCGPTIDAILTASLYYRVRYSPLVAKEDTEMPEVLGLKDYLGFVARLLELQSGKIGQEFSNESLERLGANNRPFKAALTVDAVKKVSRLLIELSPGIMSDTDGRITKRRPSHKNTAIIVNALLNLKNPLTGDRVRKILKNMQNQ